VPTHKIKLKSRKEVAAGTMAFHFEKPVGFTFIAGQAGDFTLHHPPETDKEGNKRSFSLACAPYEDDLMIATRMRDTAFKRSLKSIPLGTELSLEAPWGELTLHKKHSIPAVFLTGGIGITAIRSMIFEATRTKLAQKLILFYSNRRPEDAVFLNDLTQAQKENSHFNFITTITEPEKSSQPWKGKTGPIDKAMLETLIDDLNIPIYYICGPPEMVAAMHKMLKDAGVKSPHIRTEDFSGY
jgi:ferredoxin-NADP reductase